MSSQVPPALRKPFRVPRSTGRRIICKPDQAPSTKNSIDNNTEQVLVDLFVDLIDKKVDVAEFCDTLKALWKSKAMKPLRDMLESTESYDSGLCLRSVKKLRDEDDLPCEVDGVDDCDETSEVDGIEDLDEGCEDYCASIFSDSTSVDEEESDLIVALQGQTKKDSANKKDAHRLVGRILHAIDLRCKKVQLLSEQTLTDEEDSASNADSLDELLNEECEFIVNEDTDEEGEILRPMERKQTSSDEEGEEEEEEDDDGSVLDEDEDANDSDYTVIRPSSKRSRRDFDTSREVPQYSNKKRRSNSAP